MNWTLVSALVISLVGLVCAAYVTTSVMRNINKVGDIAEIKREAISRSLFNFYAILALVFVILVRVLDFIHSDLFIVLFIIILGGLGFKVSAELIKKTKKDN